MNWIIKAIGNAEGYALVDGNRISIKPGKTTEIPLKNIELHASTGKCSDSEDSFLFFYCSINPNEENFSLKASIQAIRDEEEPDYQTAYGIAAVDTVFSDSIQCRHRNHLMVGCFGKTHNTGVRVIGGYQDDQAINDASSRITDQNRFFSVEENGLFDIERSISLEKTDEGFVSCLNGEKIGFSGSDFLVQQDPDELYVGFLVARKIGIRISDIQFQIKPGKLSCTPEEEIVNTASDYPFSVKMISGLCKTEEKEELLKKKTVYVSPSGADTSSGTLGDPMKLSKALRIAGEDTRIRLLDGVYEAEEPFVVFERNSSFPDRKIHLEAINRGKAILNGSGMNKPVPLFVLLADGWCIDGLVFRNSPSCGLVVCGNCNEIKNCEAEHNSDTGFLIISRPDAERKDWPRYNRISECISHDNCDPVFSNADGFGAKLRVGKGNSFYRCTAFHNIDDGFDLYTKSSIGPIEPVEIDRCLAYENGFLYIDGKRKEQKDRGTGFKLGGENIDVCHEVWHSCAIGNNQSGFDENKNRSCKAYFCHASNNGKSVRQDFVFSDIDRVRERLTSGSISFTENENNGSSLPGFQEKNSRKNVLILVSSIGGGGAERVACSLASGLSREHDVSLMYYNRKEKTYPVSDRVRLIDCSENSRRHLNTENRIAKRILHYVGIFRDLKDVADYRKKNHIDVTISLLDMPNRYNALAWGFGKKICSERNDPSRKDARYRKWAKMSYRFSDSVVFQSERVRNQFSEKIRKKSFIIQNPVSVGFAAAEKKKKKIVTVGRLVEQKNYDMLIRAFAEFHKEHPDHHLFLYGDGELLNQLVQLAEDLKISRFVHFEGFREDVHREISDAEMFVLSSDYEGLSNALMEAMMMGHACISTNCTGTEDLIEDGINGLIVPVGDVDALSKAMCQISDNDELRTRLGKAAMEKAEGFKAETVIRRWERIL